jgi:predicted dehydrogenase
LSRLGVVGSGSIVPFHLDALKAAGFEISNIGSRPGSEKTAALAAKYGAQALDSWQDVVASNVDAFLIAPETSVTPEILAAAIATGKPILVEKPVAYSSAEVAALGNPANVLVGYNRRHYSSAAEAKKLIDSASAATFNAAIPEASWAPDMADDKKRAILLGNSVHVLDLLQYLFGPLKVAGVAKLDNASGIVTRSVSLVGERGVGSAMITFGSPSNFFVDIHTPGKSAALRPIEFYQEFVGVQVIDPTPELPLRHYVATKGEAFELSQDDLDYKPGFLSQARELKHLVDGTAFERKSATLAEAAAILALAEQLLG